MQLWGIRRVAGVITLPAVACMGVVAAPDGRPAWPRADERAAMVETVQAYLRFSPRPPGVPAAFRPPVLAAMHAVPRHEFVPPAARPRAYLDTPLDIGRGQTISQPFMVALMTEVSRAGPGSTVLEVGTGSGYQAAILAELGARVYTVEIDPVLARTAAERLTRLGFGTVETRAGDGYAGWPDAAPFDAIVVTAAPDHVPRPLVEQLAKGGRLVVPVGPVGGPQDLLVMTKDDEGVTRTERLTKVLFVPLTRPRDAP